MPAMLVGPIPLHMSSPAGWGLISLLRLDDVNVKIRATRGSQLVVLQGRRIVLVTLAFFTYPLITLVSLSHIGNFP